MCNIITLKEQPMNVFYNTIVFVSDIQKSRYFYEKIMSLKIEVDYSVFVIYENRLAIHEGNKLQETIFGKVQKRILKRFGRKNIDIYFETNELGKMEKILTNEHVKFIHKIKQQDWGQKVLRCYDPDMHIVEIGEPLHLEYLKK
jgi:catechol 2,3-dioxygenase-like lactoylglutathione lyase family enzyme